MFLVSIDSSQVLSREWRCSWRSADRRCSNYIWVINNFIANECATYIRGLVVGTTCLVYMNERVGRQLSGEHQCQVTVASSGLLHWHWGNHTIAPVWVKRSWRTWVNKSQESTEANIVTNTKYNTTKSYAFLTHCGMANLANIGSRNGLLPEGPNTLPEPKLADHQWSPVALTWGKFREQL